MRKLDYQKIISEIQEWIKEYVISAKVKGVVVGISGGIDSAVTTTLCVKALGKKNVIGLGLPCSSIPQDLNDANKLAKILGIKFIILELTNTYNEFLKNSSSLFESNKSKFKTTIKNDGYLFYRSIFRKVSGCWYQ